MDAAEEGQDASGWAGVGFAGALRVHQQGALSAIRTAYAHGRRRSWVVLPPGAGKTLVGLLAAADLGAAGSVRKAVVLSPNTAIQSQWQAGWDALLGDDAARRDPGQAAADRELAAFFTALTYQSVATFDPEADAEADPEVDTDPAAPARLPPASLLDRLHANGRALVERLQAAGPLLLILDECHHLLEVWGELVAELLALLPDAVVIGLTATPPGSLTAAQAALVQGLFGETVFSASMAAGVREGYLAPYAELAWLTVPTPEEQSWCAEQSLRWAELVARVSEGEDSLLQWLDRRFVGHTTGAVRWSELSRRDPALCDAALRAHHAGLMALPTGAVLHERHRHDPAAEGWVELIGTWLAEAPPRQAVIDSVRETLPAVGYQWTRRGIRPGRTPVDRVLARSEAKTVAAVQILAAEHRTLGERLRMLVLCDHESAGAMLPTDLTGVLDQEAGSARLMLRQLLAAPETRSLDPLLVTGRTVAGSRETLTRLAAQVDLPLEVRPLEGSADGSVGVSAGDSVRDSAGETASGSEVCALVGPWDSRAWVRHVTDFFTAGGAQVLIGTRALLGEGWDAPAISGLIDLTTATTLTSVVQTRGRAVRRREDWPDKVAVTWSVVCVAPEHPRGDNDWQRLVRKHEGFLGVDEDGEVVDGVGHLDPAFSPFAPPEVEEFDRINARMLLRAERRAEIAARWRVGEAYADRVVETVRLRPTSREAVSQEPVSAEREQAAVVARPGEVEVRGGAVPSAWGRPAAAGLVVGVLAVVAVVLGAPWLVVPLAAVVIGVVVVGHHAARGAALRRSVPSRPSIGQVASAVADAMREVGESPVGAEAVAVVFADGEYRCRLAEATPEVAARFAAALDEATAPIAAPRYVLPRGVFDARGGLVKDVRVSLREEPEGEIWHAVPSLFGNTRPRADAYARAWNRWIGGGAALYTHSPEGAGVLAACRGSDVFAVESVLRRTWE